MLNYLPHDAGFYIAALPWATVAVILINVYRLVRVAVRRVR